MRPFTAALAALLLYPALALAHARLTNPVPRNTLANKTGPCGVARTATSVAFAPGATITVSWTETIDHPGHYRIAFSPSNDQGFDANVLKDNIPNPAGAQAVNSTTVTLPTTPCTQCTLQLIQVMTNTVPSSNYYSCADITIGSANTAPTVATAAAATVAATTAQLSALGADNDAEPALKYTWAATTGPAPVTFSVNGTNAAKSATATFTSAGAYVLRVTIADAANLTVTSSVNVTVSAALTTVAVGPAAATVAMGGTRQFTATAKDQFGASVAVPPAFVWSVAGGGAISATGLFTAGATAGGPFAVSAISGGKTGTAAVSISAGTPPTVAAPAAASAVSGATVSLSVLGADDNGAAALTYTWATTSGPAPVTFSENGTNAARATTATFTKAGTYLLEATIKDAANLTVTSAVSVTVTQALTAVTLSPPSASVRVGATQAFAAVGADQFGQPLTTPPAFTWSIPVASGTVSAAGLFTAAATAGGPFTLRATSGPVSATAAVPMG